MVSFAGYTKVIRYLSLFLAAYFLNISIDTPDALPVHRHKGHIHHKIVNEQESIVELILEKMLGYDTIIADYDDQDNEDSIAFKKSFAVDWFVLPSQKNHTHNTFLLLKKKAGIYYNSGPTAQYSDIIIPPPEV